MYIIATFYAQSLFCKALATNIIIYPASGTYMNDIEVMPREIAYFESEGIEFRNRTFIEVKIDDWPIIKMNAFAGSVIFWPELLKSSEKTGKYLIFTCICGVADDSGWEVINVIHSDNQISWVFERNGEHKYHFDKRKYIHQIRECEKRLKLSEYPLDLESAIFPER